MKDKMNKLLYRRRIATSHAALALALLLVSFAAGVGTGRLKVEPHSPLPVPVHPSTTVGEQGPWFYLHQMRTAHQEARTEAHRAVEHVTVTSAKPYEAVRRSFEARLSKLDENMRAMTRTVGRDESRSSLVQAAGKDGIVWHYTTTHGEWLLMRDGKVTTVTEYFVGNILYPAEAQGTLAIDGLYAPLRIVMYENSQGSTTIEYDKPSTRLSQHHSKEIDAVGQLMDQRIARLAVDADGEVEPSHH